MIIIMTIMTMMTITMLMMIDDHGDGCGDSGDCDAVKMMVSDHQKVTDFVDRASSSILFVSSDIERS